MQQPGRRNVSGPPDLYHPSYSYRAPPDELFLGGGSASDPNLGQPRPAIADNLGPDQSTDEDEDDDEESEDDEDQGVQVEVVEKPSGYESKVAAPANSGIKSRGGGAAKARRTRR